MKKILSIILSLVLLLSVSSVVYADNDITVKLDGKTLEFDVQPQLIGGRTMVPLRVIFESLGAVVEWDNDTSTVIAYNEFYFVKATIGNNTMIVNGKEKQMDVPPMTVNDRTLVPARFVAEAFNCNVEWDGNTKTVYITSGYNDYSKVEQSSQIDSNISVKFYDNTRIPTYTSITGRNLDYNIPTSDGDMIYVYSYDKNSAKVYVDYLIHHNWWQTNKDNDSNGLFCFYQNNQYREKICIAIDEDANEIQIITVTNFLEDATDNSNAETSTEENNAQCYQGTSVPTYTSVTRYNIHDTYITDDNDTMYIYVYDENAVKNYVNTLNKKGWETTLSEPNNQGNYRFILTNDIYKERVHILVSLTDHLVCIMTGSNLLECYPGTNIPTYTSITGDELLETFEADNKGTIYSYVEDETSLTNYLDFIGNNGWDVKVVDGEDNSYCNVIFTSQRKNQESFAMSVEFAYGEIWIYIEK